MGQIDVQRPHHDVTVLTLNHPEKLNALSFELVEEIHRALDEIGADNSCRVLVLTGAARGSAPVSISQQSARLPWPKGPPVRAQACDPKSGSLISRQGSAVCANR